MLHYLGGVLHWVLISLYLWIHHPLLDITCSMALETIQRENRALKKILLETFDSRPCNLESRQSLLLLLEQQDRNLEAQLLEIRNYVLEEIDRHAEAERALENHKITHGSVALLHQETELAEKRLHQLEDKRHKSLVEKGEAEHTSRITRSSIDSLRRERLLFDEMQRKKRKELLNIAHDVSTVVNESIDRIESTQKSNAFLKQIREVFQSGESNWSRAWREQIQRMEEFTNQEMDAQRQRCSGKRNRVMAMLQSNRRQSSSSISKSSKQIIKSSISSNCQSTCERFYSDDIDAVAMHIGSTGPDHLVKIVKEFESLKSACLLQRRHLNSGMDRQLSTLIEKDHLPGVDQDETTQPAREENFLKSKEELTKIIGRIMSISGIMEASKITCADGVSDGVGSEERLLCVVSLLEIWVHMAMHSTCI